jgi:hypothetical protein
VWCALTGLTLLAMRAKDWWIAPAAAVSAVVRATVQARKGRRPSG